MSSNIEEQQSSSTMTSNLVVNMSQEPVVAYDVKKVIEMNNQESRCNDMEFELDQLRLDNCMLNDDVNREQKTAVLYRNLYSKM